MRKPLLSFGNKFRRLLHRLSQRYPEENQRRGSGHIDTELLESSRRGDAEAVRSLLKAGADPNAFAVEYVEGSKQTPLVAAVVNSKVHIATLLVHAGANPKIKQRNRNWTVLHGAAHLGDYELVQSLLAAGCDVNAQDDNGHTPLHWAAFNNSPNVVRLLIEQGAAVNVAGSDGWTPLHRAAFEGNTDVAELLVESGAEINARSQSGDTALSVAGSYIPSPTPAERIQDMLRRRGGLK